MAGGDKSNQIGFERSAGEERLPERCRPGVRDMNTDGGDSSDERMGKALAGLTDIASNANVCSLHGVFHIRACSKPDFVKDVRRDIFVV